MREWNHLTLWLHCLMRLHCMAYYCLPLQRKIRFCWQCDGKEVAARLQLAGYLIVPEKEDK